MIPVDDKGDRPFFRWLVSYLLTVEFFKTVLTMMVVSVYCYLTLQGEAPSSEFGLMVGMLLGFYFKASKGGS